MGRKGLALPSKRLILAYVLDWVVIIAIAAVAYAFGKISPFHRPFSLLDLSISFPHAKEQVPPWLLIVVALFAPAVIILLVSLILVPGPTASRSTPKSLIWRRKFWEWNTGWMGLGLSLATTYLITNGMKNLFGKPRPDLLARCVPDLANVANFYLGGLGQDISPQWTLVDYHICQQEDRKFLDDGFRSFPSGHSSFAWAGLLYLSLFLCSKFAIAIPFLTPRPYSQDPTYTALEKEQRDVLPLYHHRRGGSSFDKNNSDEANGTASTNPSTAIPSIVPIRNQAAAPPTHLLVLALVPVGAAIYITSSRYADFRHFGFDVITGSLIGIIVSWFAFRWYHLPIRQGAGWAWGARTRERAFGIGIGVGGYVGLEGWGSRRRSVELQAEGNRDILGPGVAGPIESGVPVEQGETSRRSR